MTGWVPGLRRARVVTTYPTRLPHEVTLEFSGRSHTLAYAYDLARFEVSWRPRRGAGPRGFARVEPSELGATFTFGIENDPLDVEAVVGEFAAWMHAY